MFNNPLSKINSRLHRATYRRIGENMLALGLLNGIYMLSPLILIPYLMRTIGAESYGIYIFSWTFIYYFIFIVNYGFDFSATKEIAIHRDDNQKVSAIFSSTFVTRLLLVLVSFILLACCLLLVPKFNAMSKLILLGAGVIVGQALFPTWLFQGMQEMKFITFINAITRLTPLALIFIFVKSEADIGLIMLFQSVGYLIGGIFSHIFSIKHYKLNFIKPTFSDIKKCLAGSCNMFLSTVGISFYRETNTLILGFVTGNFELVGYYALADKILRAFQTLLNAFSQAIFPYFGNRMAHNKQESMNAFTKIGRYYAAILMLIVVLLVWLIPYILEIYLGENIRAIVIDSRILLPVILVGGLNYYYGIVGLVNLDKQRAFTKYVLIAGITNIALCLILSHTLADPGAAISLVIAECVLLGLIIHDFSKLNHTNNNSFQ